MTARLLKITIALATLLVELRYTMSRLAASGLLPAYLVRFQALRDTWTTIQAKEIELHELLSDANALVDVADDKLDAFARRFEHAVLALTGQSQTAALYKHYFKKPLSVLIRPVLSGELRDLDAWADSLKEPSTPPQLAALLPELRLLLKEGHAAETTRDSLVTQIKQFRQVGERRQFIDHVNAERKELAGALSALVLSTPALPADLPVHFFKRGASAEDPPEETVDSVSVEIVQLKADLKVKEDRLVELQQAQAAEVQKAARKAQRKATMDQMQADIEARQKALKDLEDEPEE